MDGVVAGFSIGSKAIGASLPSYVIAEAGVNHDGDPVKAHDLVDAAAAAGADAVKFQTFRPELLATAEAPKAEYQKTGTDAGETQAEMLERLQLDADTHRRLLAHCQERGIQFLSSPFDEESANLLEDLGVPAFKVASGELTNLPFLRFLAGKGLALIVSTGMATLEEVAAAVGSIRGAGNPPLALLHCVSAYPADPADCNLRAMRKLRDEFAVAVGWSDHTLGWEVAIAAVALGAEIIEKHLTLDRDLPGPDHRASLEPGEFKAMVASIRKVEAAFGDGGKTPRAAEAEIAAIARKSLVAARDLEKGESLSAAAVAFRRPGTGISPAELDEWVGRRLRRNVAKGSQLHPEMFT